MVPPQNLTIGIAVMTLQSESHLSRCLLPFLNSPLKPRLLVVDSSSTDGTVAIAKSMGAETFVIPRQEFNHGSSRELARKMLKTDIVVMLTPDAFAVDASVLEKLVQPILKGLAVVCYARQIPHEGASFFEAFPREFNYPINSQLRALTDLDQYGVYTFFCSDSCAAYLNRALDEIGGFQPVLFGEDTVAVAKLLHKSYKIAYVAEALVYHSHRYSLRQEFCRYFDVGLMRQQYRSLILTKATDSQRGREFVRLMFKRLWREHPSLLPYACAQTLTKWLGYRMGQWSVKAPVWFKKTLSSQRYYWSSTAYIQSTKTHLHS